MTLIYMHRDAPRGFGQGGAAPVPRVFRRIRATFRTINAAIAAAKLRRLRNELMWRRGHVAAPDPSRQPQLPLILDKKWDF